MALESPFAISICPRIRAEEYRLTATTSWIARILTLGLALRRVVVDRQTRTVTVDRRLGWLFRRSKNYSFDHIAAVSYGYEDVHPFAGILNAHDAIDRYLVGLRLAGSREVRLFFFLGDGVFTNDGPLPDWWYWEDVLVDFGGSQERESRLFVQLLSKLIGVTVVPSTLTRE